jgi:hypothetical protein
MLTTIALTRAINTATKMAMTMTTIIVITPKTLFISGII